MATIRLMLDPDRVTVGDLILMEEGVESPLALRNFLVKFVVDEQDHIVEGDAAVDVINALTITELRDAVQQLTDAAQVIVSPSQGGS